MCLLRFQSLAQLAQLSAQDANPNGHRANPCGDADQSSIEGAVLRQNNKKQPEEDRRNHKNQLIIS